MRRWNEAPSQWTLPDCAGRPASTAPPHPPLLFDLHIACLDEAMKSRSKEPECCSACWHETISARIVAHHSCRIWGLGNLRFRWHAGSAHRRARWCLLPDINTWWWPHRWCTSPGSIRPRESVGTGSYGPNWSLCMTSCKAERLLPMQELVPALRLTVWARDSHMKSSSTPSRTQFAPISSGAIIYLKRTEHASSCLMFGMNLDCLAISDILLRSQLPLQTLKILCPGKASDSTFLKCCCDPRMY